MSFSVTIQICLELGAPSALGGPSTLGGPLDFVHPCPMVVTPLYEILNRYTTAWALVACSKQIVRKLVVSGIEPETLWFTSRAFHPSRLLTHPIMNSCKGHACSRSLTEIIIITDLETKIINTFVCVTDLERVPVLHTAGCRRTCSICGRKWIRCWIRSRRSSSSCLRPARDSPPASFDRSK